MECTKIRPIGIGEAPGDCDDVGPNEHGAYVGDLEITGAGETHEDDLLVTPETAAEVDEAIRRWRGWDQGCVLSVFASVYPYHLACHAVCKKRPGLRIAAFVDDTYLGQGPERLYKDFRFFQKEAKRLCDLESNEDKLKAVANSGGTRSAVSRNRRATTTTLFATRRPW